MPAKLQTRFKDDGRLTAEELDLILVGCPRCGGRADVVQDAPAAQRSIFEPRRLICTRCAYHARTQSRAVVTAAARRGVWVDPYFGLPVYLQTATRLGVLFAYNPAHLDWLENFAGAELRERDIRPGCMNGSMASRLPRWIKLGKNRPTVLRAIEQLRQKLAEA
jgi:hypothetical protein